MRRYTIGLDFGSLSGRAVLADVEDGTILGEEVMNYPHGILNGPPGGEPSKEEWILQCPHDYVEVLHHTVTGILKKTEIMPEQIVGMGIDFTASTVIPIKNGRPLSDDPRFALRPHAWTKMWKYHGAHAQAQRLTQICKRQNRPYPDWYGGSISPECLMAKVLQVFDEDREVYDETDCFMEAADYITSLLTGKPVFGFSLASAKALWSKKEGYPDSSLFKEWSQDLADLPGKLMEHDPGQTPVMPGHKAGVLCRDMAKKLGLKEGIAVSAPQMDAYAGIPGLGMTQAGDMLLMVGTSTAVILLGDGKDRESQDGRMGHGVRGVTASLPDTCYPGLWTYATGQASVGDCFHWCTKTCVPESYSKAAREKNQDLHGYLSDLASKLEPAQTGLIALDWFNGNKSLMANSRLTGMILGLNLETKPEHIYRALLEATVFGVKAIIDSFKDQNVFTNRLVVCGGIAMKNPFLMQLYADVLGRTIEVSTCTQAAALGSAVYAAAAAGEGDAIQAAKRMGSRDFISYDPDRKRNRIYEKLYEEYKILSDYFGKGPNRVMERLSDSRSMNTGRK